MVIAQWWVQGLEGNQLSISSVQLLWVGRRVKLKTLVSFTRVNPMRILFRQNPRL
jgi:hypothetical protein